MTSNTANLEALRGGVGESIGRHVFADGGCRVKQATVDIDRFPMEVHGKQHGAGYNGHYQRKVYHPLVASLSVGGDDDSGCNGLRLGNGFLDAMLRDGPVHTADGAIGFVDRVDSKAHKIAVQVDYRLDAGSTHGNVMDDLTDKNRCFVGRLKTNNILDEMAQEHLGRPVARPSSGGYDDVIELGSYPTQSWKHAQRLILVIVDQSDPITGQLNLMPRYFFLVTNWDREVRSAEQLLDHYRRRGTVQDRLGEFNSAIGVHLSQPNFQENEATMLLALSEFNLTAIGRNELEEAVGGCWDLKRFQLNVLKGTAQIVKHARRLVMLVAPLAAPLGSQWIARIQAWPTVKQQNSSRPSGYMPPSSHAYLHEVPRT